MSDSAAAESPKAPKKTAKKKAAPQRPAKKKPAAEKPAEENAAPTGADRFPDVVLTTPEKCGKCGAELGITDAPVSSLQVVAGIVEVPSGQRTKRRRYDAVRRRQVACDCGLISATREYLAAAPATA